MTDEKAWLEFNDSAALELEEGGRGDAAELGMHALSTASVRLWKLSPHKIQPDSDYYWPQNWDPQRYRK